MRRLPCPAPLVASGPVARQISSRVQFSASNEKQRVVVDGVPLDYPPPSTANSAFAGTRTPDGVDRTAHHNTRTTHTYVSSASRSACLLCTVFSKHGYATQSRKCSGNRGTSPHGRCTEDGSKTPKMLPNHTTDKQAFSSRGTTLHRHPPHPRHRSHAEVANGRRAGEGVQSYAVAIRRSNLLASTANMP